MPLTVDTRTEKTTLLRNTGSPQTPTKDFIEVMERISNRAKRQRQSVDRLLGIEQELEEILKNSLERAMEIAWDLNRYDSESSCSDIDQFN